MFFYLCCRIIGHVLETQERLLSGEQKKKKNIETFFFGSSSSASQSNDQTRKRNKRKKEDTFKYIKKYSVKERREKYGRQTPKSLDVSSPIIQSTLLGNGQPAENLRCTPSPPPQWKEGRENP